MSDARSSSGSASVSQEAWLLLVHQLPAKPSRTRVKTWRRLQAVGAVAIKNSVYVLPRSDEGREDLEWIRGEIISQGGQACPESAIRTRFFLVQSWKRERERFPLSCIPEKLGFGGGWENSLANASSSVGPFFRLIGDS